MYTLENVCFSVYLELENNVSLFVFFSLVAKGEL